MPADQDVGGRLLANPSYEAYRTNESGYLQGASNVIPGDRLVALWPITSTNSYTVYYTSAPTTTLGLNTYEVKGTGTQELIVSKANPLLLFNLDVSLEWDARNDGTFLDDLTEAIKRASETFYSVSGGQMALGKVTIFQNKENWLNSDIVIYANSSVRPRRDDGRRGEHPDERCYQHDESHHRHVLARTDSHGPGVGIPMARIGLN